MKNCFFKLPCDIHFGYSTTSQIPGILAEAGANRVLVVVDFGLRAHPVVESLKKALTGRGASVEAYDEIRGEPTTAQVQEAMVRLDLKNRFDAVVGIGGGSAIDVAKTLAASVTFKGSLNDVLGTDLVPGKGLFSIMVPTTSGTGAEVTPNAILRDEEKETKSSIVSKHIIPDVVVVDPVLTLTLPPKPTAETGIDAFTHAIECFIGNKSNPVSDTFAWESMRLAFASLRTAVHEGSNREARYNMALASLYGGISITLSGTGGVHALAYPLGGRYKVTHGLSNAVLLAEVMAFNAPSCMEKFLRVADAAGIPTAGVKKEDAVARAVAEIRSLVKDVGIVKPDIDTSAATLDWLATSAMNYQRLLVNNPRPMTAEDARGIYARSLA